MDSILSVLCKIIKNSKSIYDLKLGSFPFLIYSLVCDSILVKAICFFFSWQVLILFISYYCNVIFSTNFMKRKNYFDQTYNDHLLTYKEKRTNIVLWVSFLRLSMNFSWYDYMHIYIHDSQLNFDSKSIHKLKSNAKLI